MGGVDSRGGDDEPFRYEGFLWFVEMGIFTPFFPLVNPHLHLPLTSHAIRSSFAPIRWNWKDTVFYTGSSGRQDAGIGNPSRAYKGGGLPQARESGRSWIVRALSAWGLRGIGLLGIRMREFGTGCLSPRVMGIQMSLVMELAVASQWQVMLSWVDGVRCACFPLFVVLNRGLRERLFKTSVSFSTAYPQLPMLLSLPSSFLLSPFSLKKTTPK